MMASKERGPEHGDMLRPNGGDEAEKPPGCKGGSKWQMKEKKQWRRRIFEDENQIKGSDKEEKLKEEIGDDGKDPDGSQGSVKKWLSEVLEDIAGAELPKSVTKHAIWAAVCASKVKGKDVGWQERECEIEASVEDRVQAIKPFLRKLEDNAQPTAGETCRRNVALHNEPLYMPDGTRKKFADLSERRLKDFREATGRV